MDSVDVNNTYRSCHGQGSAKEEVRPLWAVMAGERNEDLHLRNNPGRQDGSEMMNQAVHGRGHYPNSWEQRRP